MKRSFDIIRLLLFVYSVFCISSIPDSANAFRAVGIKNDTGLKFITDKPKYARIALDQEGVKILGAAFDEGQGIGSRYDTAYIFNANTEGPIKKYIKIESSGNYEKENIICTFNPTVLRVRFNEYSRKVDEQWELTFQTIRDKSEDKPKEKGKEVEIEDSKDKFALSAVLRLRDTCEWEYGFTREFETTDTLTNAPILMFNNKIKVGITTARMEDKVGMNIKLTSGECGFFCENDYGILELEIEIANSEGKIIEHSTQRLNNLKYRIEHHSSNSPIPVTIDPPQEKAEMKGYYVRIPKGKYTFKIKFDTGPLLGVVTHEEEITFKN